MKKRVYFLAPYPMHEAPSQRFRFEQYLKDIEKEGIELTFLPFYSYKDWQTLYQKGALVAKSIAVLRSFFKRFSLFFHLHQADAVFIHREVAHVGPPVFEWLIAKVWRKPFVYDFDDAIWMPNYSESNKRFHWLKAYWKVNYCMKWAKIVTAGNEYLAEYARKYNTRVVVIPTSIDTVNRHNRLVNHDLATTIIGWTGTHTTQKYLNELLPIIEQLHEEFDVEFRIISNQAPDFTTKNMRWIKWTKETEIDDLVEFHIGLMPLQSDQWSDGKCGFKALQYMSLGIATVASPIGVNTTIIQHAKNGLLATTSDEWYTALKSLLENKQTRKELGLAGKQTVEKKYSVNALRSSYLSIINEITTK